MGIGRLLGVAEEGILLDDVHHAALLVLRAELRLLAAGNTKVRARCSATSGVVAPLAEDANHPIFVVLRAKFRLVAAGNAKALAPWCTPRGRMSSSS